MTNHLRDLRHAALDALSSKANPDLWRRHGTGMLQLYLTPAHRIHVWHPDLFVAGMTEGGAWHNHRFNLASTVLTGELLVTNIQAPPSRLFPESSCGVRDYRTVAVDVWEIPGASQGKTAELRLLQESVSYEFGSPQTVDAGQSHQSKRGAFHWARQDIWYGHVTVTSVVLWDKQDTPARLLCPPGARPVHAFESEASRHDKKAILDMAARDLRRHLAKETTF